MARPKYTRWLEPEGLAQITNWAAKGCTYEELAKNMGVGESTLYTWLDAHQEILDAIKTGREMSIEAVENRLFEMAMGGIVEETETKEAKQARIDGKMVTVEQYIKKTTRRLPPNVTALIFYLKNRAGYRDNPPENVDAGGTLEKARELLAGVPSAID